MDSSLRRVRVTVPATSANLGPGFDCLGLALNLRNTVTFATSGVHTSPDRAATAPLSVTVSGIDAAKIPVDGTNLVVQTAYRLFGLVGRWPQDLELTLENGIPVGSGLGSSSAAVVAGLLGANALVDGGLGQHELLQIATAIEGHPDNVSPAILGGLVLGVMVDRPGEPAELLVDRLVAPPMTVVVVLPDVALLTSEARALLPTQISRRDAIFNMSRVGLLVHALSTADHARLRVAMDDRLHQPYRLPIIPGAQEALAAAYESGASGVALSGAGPSLIAFAPGKHQAIADSMTAAFAHAGQPSRSWTLSIDAGGATVEVI